jgi:hypothetical protein
MISTRVLLLAVSVFWFIPCPHLSAKQPQKSHEDCLKLVPGDWGPNFGDEWKQHEAVYWGCRLGVPVETIHEWQDFGSGMIADLIPVTVDNMQIVIVESMEGSAHCYTISAVRKSQKGWKSIWSPPSNPESMDFCTLACPGIRIRVRGKILTLETPGSSDPKEDQTTSCKHIKWNKETYRWNGQTYQSTTHHAESKTGQGHQ